ncbi:hypothetical protein EV368DRAFT_82701 [Lentinula lateritia]|nr:hypothetical protein EV368DRAFT_82701 [Lentinula lateritia]
MFRHRFIDRRDAHHDLWVSEEIQAKYRDWPHDPKDQRFEALTERIQSQCNFLASVFSLERRVYGVKAAYYDGSPTVLVVIEDNQPLPVNSLESITLSSTSPSPSSTFTAGAFLRDKCNPSQCFILSVGHPMSSGRSPLSITEEQLTLKIGWPAILPRVERMQSHLRRLGAYTYSKKREAAFCYAQITALDGSPDQVLDEIDQSKLDRFKKRYESLQESLAAADTQHKRVSVQIERYEGLALCDTVIGHICTAFHGYAERDLSTIPKAISLDNKHIHTITDANLLDVSLIKITDPSFIPKNMWLQPFESIKELCPGQEVFMDCTAASKEQTGEVGLLKGYFGLPHLNPNPAVLDDNTKKTREAQYFVQEYSISESGFTAAGSSGAIVYTDKFAAVGMAVGHFVSLIPMCIRPPS